MKKSSVIIISLCALIVLELGVLIYDIFRPSPHNFVLAEYTTVLPDDKPKMLKIPPFLFEIRAADRVDAVLDKMKSEILSYHEHSPLSAEYIFSMPENAGSNPSNHDIKSTEPLKNAAATTDTDTDTVAGTKAVPTDLTSAKPRIAIVIDDIGLSNPVVNRLSELKQPITASFLPYGASNKEQVQKLTDAGLEVMLHVPMMPHVPADLAPVTLSPEMDETEIKNQLNTMLERFSGTQIRGINNHMGSLFTENEQAMKYVMEVLQERGLFFLDSKTTSHSAAQKAAADYDVPYISRDVFLDNKNDYDYIMSQFAQAEKIAQKHGTAVVIGHPYAATIKAISDWIKTAPQRGFELVPLSELL